MMHYTGNQWRKAVCDFNYVAPDLSSRDYIAGRLKLITICACMLQNPETRHWMSLQLRGDLEDLFDAGAPINDLEIQHDLWMLEEAGYKELADKIRGWGWS